jgi:DNA-binding MarR family transcriptional regulator
LKLEEEIQQQKFRSEKHKAALNIYYTNCFIISKFETLLKEFELTSQQYNILRILRGQKGNTITIGEIKNRMLDKNSDVSRIVERLRVKKLLERKICPNDRRQMDVKITSRGLDLLAKMDSIDQQSDKILSSLSEKEAKQLNALLDKIRE